MYKYMKGHPNVGGVCGYMSLKMERLEQEDEVKSEDMDFLSTVMTQFVDIQRTQQVEYHFAHLMDKPFEAAFGFIHVLPGAFSAYNMNAIVKYDEPEDDVLLKSYFKSISQKLADRKVISSKLKASNVILRTVLPDAINSCCISIEDDSDETMLYNENVYLAEDRILCMGIHKKGFDMAFLPDAYAEVDPMKTVHGLLGQRKRWINGSYFAFEKVKKELSAHEKENGCEFGLNLQILYLSFMNALSYFAPAFFMFTVHIAMGAFRIDVL
jgi:chitin synthase